MSKARNKAHLKAYLLTKEERLEKRNLDKALKTQNLNYNNKLLIQERRKGKIRLKAQN